MKIKKLFSTVLSCSLIVGGLAAGSNTKVKALSDVVTNVDDNVVSIGNDYISREFSIKDKTILTSSILNDYSHVKALVVADICTTSIA